MSLVSVLPCGEVHLILCGKLIPVAPQVIDNPNLLYPTDHISAHETSLLTVLRSLCLVTMVKKLFWVKGLTAWNFLQPFSNG